MVNSSANPTLGLIVSRGASLLRVVSPLASVIILLTLLSEEEAANAENRQNVGNGYALTRVLAVLFSSANYIHKN